jgi:coupling of ubiquitin conjugation to ER degradation protein 1
MANDEINVPSLVLILVVSGFIIRHFFFRGEPAPTGTRGSSETGARGDAGQQGQSRDQRRAEALDRRIEAATEHIQQIFPYADRREVWWDLRRNGVNVAATTERILAGRLDTVSPHHPSPFSFLFSL